MPEGLDPEFKRWVLWKMSKFDVREAVNDKIFVARLVKDVTYGRSKRFNKNSRFSNRREAGGLGFLRQEYEAELEKARLKRMLLICAVPRCGGSLVEIKTSEGQKYYRCTRCSTAYSQPPTKGADYKKFLKDKEEV